MTRILAGEEVTFDSDNYHMDKVKHRPRPLQPHVPVIVGASGEKVGLKLAAKYADFWQMSISPDSGEEYARKVEVLGNHCRDLGRDQATVKRLPEIATILRETTEEANDAFTAYASHFKWSAESRDYMDKSKFAGSAEQVADKLKPILATGIDGLIYQALPPYDFEIDPAGGHGAPSDPRGRLSHHPVGRCLRWRLRALAHAHPRALARVLTRRPSPRRARAALSSAASLDSGVTGGGRPT